MQGKTVSKAAAPLLLLPLPNPSWTRDTNSSSHLFLLEDASYGLGKEAAQKAAVVLEEPQYSQASSGLFNSSSQPGEMKKLHYLKHAIVVLGFSIIGNYFTY